MIRDLTPLVHITDSEYDDHVESFERAFPFIDHTKVPEEERWGRVRYFHAHVDSLFHGWALGRQSIINAVKLA